MTILSFLIFVFISFVVISSAASSASGPCDSIREDWDELGSKRMCSMQLIVIDSSDFLITSDLDGTVEGFRVNYNKNLEYLPVNIGEKFPNVFFLSAAISVIKEISTKNFRGLSKLRQLHLNDNQIKRIDDNTFEHTPAIEIIALENNQIKSLNGRAFASLNILSSLNLENNLCINEGFHNAAEIDVMPRFITRRCGSSEAETSSAETWLTEKAKLEAELQALKLDIVKLESCKAQADLQVATMKELRNEIKKTFDAMLEHKAQEISNDLQSKIDS